MNKAFFYKPIVLLTDFGESEYSGIMKGVIRTINQGSEIIDLTHSIHSQDIREAAFILYHSYSFFPEDSVFVCVVDPGVGTERQIVTMQSGRSVFISPDNGLLWPIHEKDPQARIRKADDSAFFLDTISSTFHGRDIFAPLAAHIASGTLPESTGTPAHLFSKLSILAEKTDREHIEGTVIHVDRFGNLITDIPFEMIPDGSSSRISLADIAISGITGTYSDTPAGAPAVVVSSYNTLEVTVRNGNAALMLKAGNGSRVSAVISSL